jgi:molybdopterin molybdotransferase
VSAFATFVLLVRPALLAMQGATDLEPRRFAVSAGFERGVSGGRQEYLRACLVESEGRLIAEPLVNQSSGVAASLSRSDGLLIVPPQTQVSRGDSLWFLPFSELGS